MAVLVKTLGYLSHKGAGGLSRVKAHLKYLEYGKLHENVPKGFGRDGEEKRSDFYQKIQEQPERGVIAHKLVFSLSQDERDRLGVDLKDVVKDVMAGWEAKLDRRLNWIGFEHADKGHPHVHVVVGGYAGGKQVGLYERDLRWLSQTADRSKEVLSRGAIRGELSPQQDVERLARQRQGLEVEQGHFLERIFRAVRDLGRER